MMDKLFAKINVDKIRFYTIFFQFCKTKELIGVKKDENAIFTFFYMIEKELF